MTSTAKPFQIITARSIRSFATEDAARAAVTRLVAKGTTGYLRIPGTTDQKF